MWLVVEILILIRLVIMQGCYKKGCHKKTTKSKKNTQILTYLAVLSLENAVFIIIYHYNESNGLTQNTLIELDICVKLDKWF